MTGVCEHGLVKCAHQKHCRAKVDHGFYAARQIACNRARVGQTLSDVGSKSDFEQATIAQKIKQARLPVEPARTRRGSSIPRGWGPRAPDEASRIFAKQRALPKPRREKWFTAAGQNVAAIHYYFGDKGRAVSCRASATAGRHGHGLAWLSAPGLTLDSPALVHVGAVICARGV